MINEVLVLGIATSKERWLLLAKEYELSIQENKPWISISHETYRGVSNKLDYFCSRHDFHGSSSGAALKKSKGCPQCQYEDHLYTTPEYAEIIRVKEAIKFEKKAREVHGDKYSYHVDWYAARNDALTKIWCNKHNNFFYQRPAAHIQGQNCPECGKESGKLKMTLSKREVLDKIVSFVDNPNISYEKFEYVGQHGKSVFSCALHGDFSKVINNITSGDKLLCPTCIKNKRIAFEESKFIEDATLLHGDKYDYSLVRGNYLDNRSKVPVICNTHKTVFYTSRNKHVDRSSGCLECAKLLLGRWNVDALKKNIQYHANKPCCVYLLKIAHNNVTFYKIGITSDVKVRVRLILDELTESKISVIQESWSNTIECVMLEKVLLKQVKNSRYKHSIKFGGYTECFIPDNDQLLMFYALLSAPA